MLRHSTATTEAGRPFLRLRGRWLESIGITAGTLCVISVEAGMITIRAGGKQGPIAPAPKKERSFRDFPAKVRAAESQEWQVRTTHREIVK